MAKEDPTPHALVGRAGLVFAYVCFLVALSLFGGAIYLLPLMLPAKLFLGAAVAFLTILFLFMAVAAHLVLRPRGAPAAEADPPSQKAGSVTARPDAKGSHRAR